MESMHDHVVATIARTRFPFPGQPHWPKDYVTRTNVPSRSRSIEVEGREHFPDIVIEDGTGRIREIGEIETELDEASVPYLRAGSNIADDDTGAKVRHFFLYVPAGLESEGQALLDRHGISYAGVRGYSVDDDGLVTVVPFVTPGDEYDHQPTQKA